MSETSRASVIRAELAANSAQYDRGEMHRRRAWISPGKTSSQVAASIARNLREVAGLVGDLNYGGIDGSVEVATHFREASAGFGRGARVLVKADRS